MGSACPTEKTSLPISRMILIAKRNNPLLRPWQQLTTRLRRPSGPDSKNRDPSDQDSKKQMSRRLSQTQLKQYGIEDDTENIFASTMCMENSRMSSSLHMTAKDLYNEEFKSEFEPNEMRCLALVAHNHMKPAMRDFVISHKEILRKFRLTGTNTTMAMLREVFGDDPTVQYGPSFASGPLGGD